MNFPDLPYPSADTQFWMVVALFAPLALHLAERLFDRTKAFRQALFGGNEPDKPLAELPIEAGDNGLYVPLVILSSLGLAALAYVFFELPLELGELLMAGFGFFMISVGLLRRYGEGQELDAASHQATENRSQEEKERDEALIPMSWLNFGVGSLSLLMAGCSYFGI
jgi:hypothetical protein